MTPADRHVIVKFGKAVPYDVQCALQLKWEKELRESTGVRIEVFTEARGDDSKLRAAMTPEQRNRL